MGVKQSQDVHKFPEMPLLKKPHKGELQSSLSLDSSLAEIFCLGSGAKVESSTGQKLVVPKKSKATRQRAFSKEGGTVLISQEIQKAEEAGLSKPPLAP